MKLDAFFLFTWRKLLIIALISFISIFLINLVSALLYVEESFFFIIAVIVIPIYVIVIIIYNLVRLVQKK